MQVGIFNSKLQESCIKKSEGCIITSKEVREFYVKSFLKDFRDFPRKQKNFPKQCTRFLLSCMHLE